MEHCESHRSQLGLFARIIRRPMPVITWSATAGPRARPCRRTTIRAEPLQSTCCVSRSNRRHFFWRAQWLPNMRDLRASICESHDRLGRAASATVARGRCERAFITYWAMRSAYLTVGVRASGPARASQGRRSRRCHEKIRQPEQFFRRAGEAPSRIPAAIFSGAGLVWRVQGEHRCVAEIRPQQHGRAGEQRVDRADRPVAEHPRVPGRRQRQAFLSAGHRLPRKRSGLSRGPAITRVKELTPP